MTISFTPVSRDELPKVATRTNSASASMFNDFLAATEAGDIVQIDIPEDAKSTESVRSTLQNYITRHDHPVKLFSRAGNLYMERLSAEDFATYKVEAAAKSAKRKPRTPKAATADATTAEPAAVDGELVGAIDEG